VSKLIIGLTGGIGSGKTTTANFFKQLNIDVIDADEISREIVSPTSPATREIAEHFGAEILQRNGHLNRTLLRKIVFAHPDQKAWLEQLLHPQIIAILVTRIQQATSPYCVAVIPLLFELHLESLVDRILIINISPTLQQQRAARRDDVTPGEITAIMQQQMNAAQRIAQADDIINNDGSLEELQAQVKQLHESYLAQVGKL
jgi:dephospho-CoA kinase